MNFFDRIAAAVSKQVAHAWFFCLCVLLVIVWVPSILVIGNVDTWQLIINTLTTIITFLLVALLQNDQQQFENAVHHKLDTQTKGIMALLNKGGTTYNLNKELHDSIGSEKRIGASE